MKRFNCDKAGCSICWKASYIVDIFGIKIYKCAHRKRAHGNIKAKDCLDFRCGNYIGSKECRRCRRGRRRK